MRPRLALGLAILLIAVTVACAIVMASLTSRGGDAPDDVAHVVGHQKRLSVGADGDAHGTAKGGLFVIRQET